MGPPVIKVTGSGNNTRPGVGWGDRSHSGRLFPTWQSFFVIIIIGICSSESSLEENLMNIH